MANIDYVIGAKNDASGPIGEAAESLDKLGDTSKKTADVSEKATQRISMGFGDLAKMATAIGAVDVAIGLAGKAISGIVGSFSAANAAFDVQTESVKGLETALRLNGEEVEAQSSKLQAFASDLQSLTGVGDEVTLGLMRQSAMLGIEADQLDDAAKAAIGLSEATGKGLDESLVMVNNALQGQFGAFGEVIPAINEAATASEKLAMVQALAAKGIDAKADSADRLAGMEERAAGAVGDMIEQVGALLAPVRLLIASGIKVLAETLGGLLTSAAEQATVMMERMEPVLDAIHTSVVVMGDAVGTVFGIMADIFMDFFGTQLSSAEDMFTSFADKLVDGVVWLVNSWIGYWTAIEVVYNNFGKVVEMAVSSVLLQYETLRADTEQLFTVVIPTYIGWFADNFFNIIDDVANAVINVIGSMGKIIANHMLTIFEFIRGGMQGGIGGLMSDLADNITKGMDDMLDGFESKTESLPDIMARKITDREQELQDRIGQIGTELGDEFADKFAERSIKLGEKVSKDLSADIELKLGENAVGGDETGKSNTQELQSKEARLLTRGTVKDRQEELLNMMKHQSRVLDVIAKHSKGTDEATTSMSKQKNLKVQVVN